MGRTALTTSETRQIVLEASGDAATGVGLWIAALDDARDRTLEILDGLDPVLLDAGAPYHRHTIGSLLYHIALIEADWLYVEIREEESYPAEIITLFPYDVRDEHGHLTRVTGLSLNVHLERLARVRELLSETLMKLTDEEFSAARQIPDATVSTAWVVHHLLQHEAEHRGEIGQILNVLRTRAD